MSIEDYMIEDLERSRGVAQRIAEKTRINTDTGCVEWVAKARANGGYGVLCVGRRGQIRAHRAAWVLANGLIPQGMYVCHKCDNPLCVNVDHLFIGTARDNMDDKEAKGRGTAPPHKFGASHHKAKFTEEDFNKIRDSTEKYGILAERYSVSQKTIWRVKSGKTWRKYDEH
jgi:hypothetical protein